MQELNSAVDVSVMIGDLSIPSVANFDIVVAVNQALEKNGGTFFVLKKSFHLLSVS